MNKPKKRPLPLLEQAKLEPKQTEDLRGRLSKKIKLRFYRAAELLLEKGWKINRIAKWIA